MPRLSIGSHRVLQDLMQASVLGIVVFISRYLTRAPVYYVDGPSLVQSILHHTYVIQPPGYWLFARVGGLFTDPALGLQLLNEFFSATGAAVFFMLCRKLSLDRKMAWSASLCYASIFFIWLAGDIHSSYASQMLFAPLLVYLFVCYRDHASVFYLLACGICFAFGSGFRPSDGGFLAPLFIFLAYQLIQGWRRRVLLITVTVFCGLVWYIPGQAASRAAHIITMGHYINIVRPMSLLLSGITSRTLGNVVRVILPFFVAFGILIPVLFFKHGRFENRIIVVWVAPGMLFFLTVYMADPVYFTYLSGALVLLAALSRQQTKALVLLILCFVFNVALFLFARPVQGNNRVEQALNFYVVKYCDYGITHQWKSTIGSGAIVP